MKALGAIFALLVIIIGFVGLVAASVFVSAIINGWVLTKLWGWFMVPIFEMKPLHIAPAIGISMVAAFLCGTTHLAKSWEVKDKGKEYLHMSLAIFIAPFVTLLCGYIVHLFM